MWNYHFLPNNTVAIKFVEKNELTVVVRKAEVYKNVSIGMSATLSLSDYYRGPNCNNTFITSHNLKLDTYPYHYTS